MQQINTPIQYKELVTEAKKKGFTLSNCFFLPDAIREKTEKGTLFAQWIKNGLLILEDAGTFYRCYYYFSKDEKTEPVTLNKKAVIEFPFASCLSDVQKLQEEQILRMGFSLGRESAQMTALPEEIQSCSEISSMVQVEYARDEDAENCLNLIRESFNELYAFIPEIDEMRQYIRECRITVIRDKDKPVAVLHCAQQKQFVTIHHVSVARSHRRRGFANTLLSHYHRSYADKVKGFCHWVDIHNEAAVQMYQALGYHFGLRKANEYIKL